MDAEMTAGPELDMLIAEKVMGWSLVRGKHEDVWMDATGKRRAVLESRLHMEEYEAPWSPSTEIADAWQVVEGLNEKGIHLWAVGQEDALPGWQADFGRNYQSAHQAWAETAPLAICRAALVAVSV